MIIKNITVREFGPLEGFSADLAPGVNLIEGANESGKSSLIGFIRFILYGLPARRGDGIAERDRALSWKGSAADGSMTVEYDGGGYRIERRAVLNGTRDNCVDRVRIIDLATGTEVHKGEAPGKVFLGVPQNVFDSTACIRQLDIGGLDGAGIGAAIENMLFSADATLNVKNATTRLTNARRALRNQRMQNGELDILERRRAELTARLSRAEESAKNISEARAQAEKCRTLAAEVRRSLNSNEDRLTAYGGLQTLHRFDMLHAGERKIAALRAQRDSLESAGGSSGYLPDREYAPALDAARRRGRRIIERKLQRSCFYYGRALRYALPIDNETYVLTLRGALCGFFRIYDPLFAAHDRRIGCDYPTALPVAGLCGIEYIEEYTRRLYFESLFCSALSPDLLRAACVFYAPDSRHAIFSVMSAVLEGLILGSVGVALPAPGKKTSRADVLRRFYAAASALGHEKYLASVSETMHRAVGKAAAAAGDGEFGVFSTDRNGFCDYCLAAAKKTAPELLSVSGAVI